jgi:hypothetical protein
MSLADNTFSAPYVLYISSNNRASGDNSNFQSAPIDLGINKYDACCVCQASIPRSFYNVPSGYNTFILKEGVFQQTITIPVGSYNRINLQNVLQTQLNLISPNDWVYVVSYPNTTTEGDTFKYSFSVSGNGGTQPQFIFTNGMFRQLGFDQNTTNTFSANSLTSTNCINLAYATRAFIKSNISFGNEVLQEVFGYGSYPMLSVAYFEQQDYDLNSRIFNPSNLNSWSFTLVDAFDQLIDLNGVPWSLSIVVYDRNNTHEILKTDLEFRNEERLIQLQTKEDELKTIIEQTEFAPTQGIFTGQDISIGDIPIDRISPIYPVKPFSSSTSIIPLTLPEPLEEEENVEKPKNRPEKKTEKK